MTNRNLHKGLIATAFLVIPFAATAGDLIYQPVVPAFGGNPNNFNYLIGTAQIQNQFGEEQGGGGGGGGAPEINFPPIVIDLGGVGAPQTTTTADPTNAQGAGGAANNTTN